MPDLECQNCDGTGEAGVKYRPDGRAIFQLGKPRCPVCLGTGEVPTEQNEELKATVRKLRAEHHTYRAIAEIVHWGYTGNWMPKDNQLVGEALCAEAGIDRNEEFQEFCRERQEKNRC